MRLTIQRANDDGSRYATDPDGRWFYAPPFSRGDWTPVDPPAWAVVPAREDAHPMTDPYERNGDDVTLVTVRRVIVKTVPDYEAEVLLRNGWEVVT